MRISTLTLFAVLLTPLALHSAEKPLEISTIVTQQQQIRSEVMASKGRYADMPSAKRSELLSNQDALLRMLDGKETADDLTEQQKMQAFNTLEWIEAAINDEDGDRMVCTRERTLGSNRVTRVCRTVAQMAEARERAREDLMRNQGTQMMR